jgi:hypothetical protein
MAIRKYPRHGCAGAAAGLEAASESGLLGKHLVQLVRIEANHDFVANNNSGSGTAVICTDHLKDRLLVLADVLDFKLCTFLRKVGLGPVTRRSTGLAEDHNLFVSHCYSFLLFLLF